MEFCKQDFRERIGGVLIGTALGDALGFIAEQLECQRIKELFGRVDRFHVFGNRGFVTDDTEHTALISASLAGSPEELSACVKDFRRALLSWYLCFPFGIGKSTMNACMRIAGGLQNSGVPSAGNGAAMRSAVIGAFYFDDREKRVSYGRALAQVTHTDSRGVEGALFVGELAAAMMRRSSRDSFNAGFGEALEIVENLELRESLEGAAQLAGEGVDFESAAEQLVKKPYAFVLNSLPYCVYSLLRYGEGELLDCLTFTVGGGGDTDTNAAIVGALLGAARGQSAMPSNLVDQIDDGPFGPTHLQKLADALAEAKFGEGTDVPGYSHVHSLIRNMSLVPVILLHALLRILR